MRTLRQVCDELGVSRRAIQGYEKKGLIAATGRTERGYLLYDEQVRERINKIKLYQELGFSLAEIKDIIDEYSERHKELLRERIIQLEKERKHVDWLIQTAYDLIAKM
ncbi:MAG: MerR family transcriptional regulator [Lachnospiraceae bacterium]|nr:MerR family transcriptional regulator [Lachnospiraceae bacterium]